MTETTTLHCDLCAREFQIPRAEYELDEFKLYCEARARDILRDEAGE